MKPNQPGRALRPVLTVVLCALFFLLAMGIVLLGSGVYRGAVAAADENYIHRTALSYLVNQVRRGDAAGGVSLGSFGGADALYLREAGYVTVLYCYDGQLRELYAEEGLEFAPEDGAAVLPLASLALEGGDGVITITAEDADGTVYTAGVAPRSGYTGEAGA